MGQDDHKAVLLAGLRSGLIAFAIGLLILLLHYPIQKLGFAILTGSSFGLGFAPLAIIAWQAHSNHLLWASLTLYIGTLMLALGVQLPRTQDRHNLEMQALR